MDKENQVPEPGTPEHDAALAAKYDERMAAARGESPAPEAPTRPDNVPEEFWDAEKGEVKLDALLEAAKAPKQEPEKKTDEQPQDEADKALEGTGIDIDALRQEFAEKGALSEESYALLEKVGFGKDIVDSYIEGQAAIAERERAKVVNAVGGEEQFNQIITWAANNMTDAEKAAYNKAVEEGTPEERMLAVTGLRARYESENGSAPKLLGGKQASTAAAGFASRAEQSAAINKRDERGRRLYDIDPAYRAQVAARIAASNY